MEHQLWKQIVAFLETIDKPRNRARCTFKNEEIVLVWFWAVLHDRPVCWACDRRNWPICLRRKPLPRPSTMSRRLRSEAVKTIMVALEKETVRKRKLPSCFWMMDGKPLVISSISKDRQAGYGRAARGKAKGYKLHAIVAADGCFAAWRMAPMNKDERVMARRLVREANIQGYLVGDGNYDSNPLHEVCEEQTNLQLVTPPRGGLGKTKRRKKQSLGRRRSLEMQENPHPDIVKQLFKDRNEIERQFGKLTNWGGGLTHLPPWARTHRRVHRWVQAKLIINDVKRRCNKTTYVD
jgi:hypothetical protein